MLRLLIALFPVRQPAGWKPTWPKKSSFPSQYEAARLEGPGFCPLLKALHCQPPALS